MIVTPPSLAGGDHETVTDPLPGVPLTLVGWPGVVRGTTLPDALDAGLVPAAFVAVTVNVYDAPFVSPLIKQLVAGVAGATAATEQFSPVPAAAV